jgi:hypothetical protein
VSAPGQIRIDPSPRGWLVSAGIEFGAWEVGTPELLGEVTAAIASGLTPREIGEIVAAAWLGEVTDRIQRLTLQLAPGLPA